MDKLNAQYFGTREEWRYWLSQNHQTEKDVWLIYYKKGSAQPSIPYEDSVEEALCFGWVDSLIKKMDEVCYARKFTPRTGSSVWSQPNKRRVERMMAAGLMTDAGLRLVNVAKKSGFWDKQEDKPQLTFIPLPDFAQALHASPAADAFFGGLSFTEKKRFLGWIENAKRLVTRQRRIVESIHLLEKGKKLGLK